MRYSIIPVTPFEQNCTLLWCEQTAEAAVVDPGGDLDRILAEVDAKGVTPVKILLTHTHIDHVGGTGELSQRLDLPIEGPHRDDRPWLDALDRQESCGGHFNEAYETEEHEALRDDDNYCHVSAWEYTGKEKEPQLHKEPLVFENVELAQRSYK